MDFEFSNGEHDHQDQCCLSPLHENLNDSHIDPDKLLSNEETNMFPIGMDNFRSKFKSNKTSPIKYSNLTLLMQQESNKKPKTDTEIKKAIRERWQKAIMKVKLIKDPWYEFKIENYPVEHVVRHRYNPVRKEWKKDECVVKMETKQFAEGAMRACFRLKKLSNFSASKSWDHAQNYVAKCYKSEEMPRERYFDDVKLQMDAKLWSEVYNRHNPPKKIDIFQMCILEFVDRPESPLFHLEHYIEGKYIKYNSNCGFVEDIHLRYTPHAFSHFTFESSNHELIIVDIQGVGDLYTDPQIHTARGTEYGDGNLGVKGFALFFYSHICNEICKSLGLTQFDLAPNELSAHNKILNGLKASSATRTKGKEEPVFGSHAISARTRLLLNRLNSNDITDICEVDEAEGYSCSPVSPGTHIFGNSYSSNILSKSFSSSNNTSFAESPFLNDDAFKYFSSGAFNRPRPSAVVDEKHAILNADTEFIRRNFHSIGNYESILGKVHLEMCKYHEFGRFVAHEDDNIDHEAAFFHLQQAANLGVTEALINIAKIYMQLPCDLLTEYKVDDNDDNYEIGFDYMIEAAEKGDKNSLYFVAKAFDTGVGLSKNRTIDWNRAIEYYRKLISKEDQSEEHDFTDISSEIEAAYLILARIGEMYLEAKYGIEKNCQEAADLFNEAAERAIAHGKGRLANKYYVYAENALAGA